jgi:hypothetical protein
MQNQTQPSTDRPGNTEFIQTWDNELNLVGMKWEWNGSGKKGNVRDIMERDKQATIKFSIINFCGQKLEVVGRIQR